MSNAKYNNFVRPCPNSPTVPNTHPILKGDEARKLYLEEVKDVRDPEIASYEDDNGCCSKTRKNNLTNFRRNVKDLSNKDLFLSAQNNDIETLTEILDNTPDKINFIDDYGWSLLMIACQANSVDVVKELLKRDIDTSIRDKGGNSAHSLVLNSKNLILADLLITHKRAKKASETKLEVKHKKVKLKKEYSCDLCGQTYLDKEEHLSSTVHNINASKGRKIPASYKIPSTNKGYQLMIRGGWNRESGLGPHGDGTMYPIRTVLKQDRKGLGHEKTKNAIKEEPKNLNKKLIDRKHRYNRRIERDFRREFY